MPAFEDPNAPLQSPPFHGKRFELIAAQTQEEAQAQEHPALAIIGGKVVRADYDERTDSHEATCNGDPCTVTTRTGTASVAIDFSMVDATSGKVLLRKTLEETAEEKISAQGSPPSIDGNAMKDELLATVAASFHGLISPHAVSETVFFQRAVDKTSWRELLLAARAWRDEASAAHAQWSAGPSGTYAFSPELRQSEDDGGKAVMGLAKMGLKAAK